MCKRIAEYFSVPIGPRKTPREIFKKLSYTSI